MKEDMRKGEGTTYDVKGDIVEKGIFDDDKFSKELTQKSKLNIIIP
jgi:hypothetical protein